MATATKISITEWFDVSAWGKLADVCNQYLAKGQQVYIEGRLSSRVYETQAGEKRFSLDVNLTDVQFLGRSNRDQEPAYAGMPAHDVDHLRLVTPVEHCQ